MKKKIEPFILNILVDYFNNKEKAINFYKHSAIIQYLNLKSGAVHGNSRSRRSYAAWYSIYAITHFYLRAGYYNKKAEYQNSKGFPFEQIMAYQRSLYGGSKLQNHALNSRTNGEFSNKITHNHDIDLIVNNNGRYHLNPYYLYVDGIDISKLIAEITHKYISILKTKDNSLLNVLNKLKGENNIKLQRKTIYDLLNTDTDARAFEYISYAILYAHYKTEHIYIGWDLQDIAKKQLILYKTGRTNANDGGIDFVMKPLGRFFQVTEVGNFNKYLLDINKVLHFPLTFVVKTFKSKKEVMREIKAYIHKKCGGIKSAEQSYYKAIEGIITINELRKWLNDLNENNIDDVIDNISRYYQLELDIN